MVKPIFRLLPLIACVSVFQFAISATVQAEVRFDEDYIALVFEAEDDDTRSDRWVLTDSGTPSQEIDPDPNHSDGASGGAYIELLPDHRVTHDDPLNDPVAIWNRGAGPQAHYTMDFPEAGRYYVHIRAFSTGTEDNGIHVGLNGQFPLSGAQMQWCTAGAGWQWRSRQRNSGGAGPCGVRKTVWVTVEEPGENTFMISAREDGFEADSIMLIKDLSDNTRICSPSGVDNITCTNGSLENVDEIVDLAVTTSIDQSDIGLEESVEVSVEVRNTDGYDTAENVVLNVGTGIGSQWEVTSLDNDCDIANDSIICDLGNLAPSGPDHEIEEGELDFQFTLMPLQSGSLEIPVSIETSSVDGMQANDTDNRTVSVSDEGTLSTLAWSLSGNNATWQIGSSTTLVATAVSNGAGDATGVVLSATLPAGLVVTNRPNGCSGASRITCNVGTIEKGDQVSLSFGLTPSAAGMYSFSVEANANNLDGAAATSSVIVQVPEDEVVEVIDVEPTPVVVPVSTPASVPTVEVTSNSETEVDTNTEADKLNAAPVITSGGALLWWTLLLLSVVLYSRQIHLGREQR